MSMLSSTIRAAHRAWRARGTPRTQARGARAAARPGPEGRLRFEAQWRSREGGTDSADTLTTTLAQRLGKAHRRLRLATEVSLPLIALEHADVVELLLRLDTLGDDLQPNAVREENDRAYDGCVGVARRQITHEAAIDLELVDGEAPQIA